MDWVYAVGHEHFTMSRPNALSMMRLLDRNSDGVLNLAESVGFAIEFSWRHGPHQHGVELPDPAQ